MTVFVTEEGLRSDDVNWMLRILHSHLKSKGTTQAYLLRRVSLAVNDLYGAQNTLQISLLSLCFHTSTSRYRTLFYDYSKHKKFSTVHPNECSLYVNEMRISSDVLLLYKCLLKYFISLQRFSSNVWYVVFLC